MFDLDVILAAHGAGNGSRANERVKAFAQNLEHSLVGVRVTAAYNIGEPTHYTALVSATRSHRVVVPLLTSDGYYNARLGRDVDRAFRGGGETLVLPPVGQSERVARALAAQVVRSLKAHQFDPDSCAVVVIGHGTLRHSESGTATQVVADFIACETGLPAHTAFLDAQPSVEHVVAGLSPTFDVLVVPFLFGGGDHTEQDIPARVSAGNRRRGTTSGRVVILEPMGGLPAMSEVLETAVVATRRNRLLLKVAARASLLSRRQVELLAARLAKKGVDLQFVAFTTLGDRDLSKSISALGADDCFTGDITDALARGEVDLAVHSAKDLPLTPTEGIVDAAVLPRGSAVEALVSRTGRTLAELPTGARVGTSCRRRSSQLRRVRPELVVANIRGAVPDRVAAVDRGEFDAVILAAAGLERLQLSHRIVQRFGLQEFVPAPAQGAITVQCREDSPHRALLQRISDDNTSTAIQAELTFARGVVSDSDLIPAAYAVADSQGVLIRARVINATDHQVWDVSLHGHDASEVGREAARRLLELSRSGVSDVVFA